MKRVIKNQFLKGIDQEQDSPIYTFGEITTTHRTGHLTRLILLAFENQELDELVLTYCDGSRIKFIAEEVKND